MLNDVPDKLVKVEMISPLPISSAIMEQTDLFEENLVALHIIKRLSRCIAVAGLSMGSAIATQATPIESPEQPQTASPQILNNSKLPVIYPFGVPGVLPPGVYPPGTTAVPIEDPHPNVRLGPGVRIGPGVFINGKPANDPLVDSAIKATLQDSPQE